MENTEKQSLQRDRTAIEHALRDAGSDMIKGKTVRCPWHDDKHPSGGLYESPDGVWKFHCHKCDIDEDVIGVRARAGGKSYGDVLRDLTPREVLKPKGRVYRSVDEIVSSIFSLTAKYVYTNPTTNNPELIVARQDLPDGGKKFIQFRPTLGGFESGAPPKPWPLYNRTRVASSDCVVVVEGEKCVHALAEARIVATTSPCGAGKASQADWTPLAGKRVYLWPDNDAVGVTHMQDVAKILEQITPAPSIFWIDPAVLELQVKGDAVDYLAQYEEGMSDEDRNAVIRMVMEALAKPMTGAQSDLENFVEEMIAGKWQAVNFPWDSVSHLTQALLPGTVLCVCGDPGSGKSFWTLEAGWRWHRDGHKVAIFELEDDRRYHLLRAMAQITDNSNLTDAEWVKNNPEESRNAVQGTRDLLHGFGKCIWDAPDDPPRLEELTAWVTKRAEDGYRIIIVDPVTAAASGERPWLSDLRFMMSAKAAMRKHGASLIIVTHPRVGKGMKGLDALAGGASYPRFAQTVLWLHLHDPPKNDQVRGLAGYPEQVHFNRTIRVNKARNGRGTGQDIAFYFSGKTLRFAEQGIIINEPSEGNEDQETDRAPSFDQARKMASRLTAKFVLSDKQINEGARALASIGRNRGNQTITSFIERGGQFDISEFMLACK